MSFQQPLKIIEWSKNHYFWTKYGGENFLVRIDVFILRFPIKTWYITIYMYIIFQKNNEFTDTGN